MTGRIIKYLEPVPFEKFTPAVSRIAKPKNPTKPRVRLAHNEPVDDEIGVPAGTRKGSNMTNEIDRGPYYKMLDRQALARQSQTGESYAKAFTHVYTDPANRAIRDGARYDHIAKAMDATHGTKLSLIQAAKAAAPIDEVQDYVDPNLNPAHAELDRLIVTRMKNDPKLSYQQSFTREYLAPANRSLKERVDQESILRAQAREPAPAFPAYRRG
jgi:hypothetical protein